MTKKDLSYNIYPLIGREGGGKKNNQFVLFTL